MKNIKGFSVLLMGSFFAKGFGFFREALFFIYLGYNTDFSQILSLLAFTSVAVIFADTSLLNPILFPKWEKLNKPTIKINYYTVSVIIVLFSFCINLFNCFFVNNTQSDIVKLIASTIWIPLIFQGIFYSVLIYVGQYKKFAIAISSISLMYLLFFYFMRELGGLGYLYSRVASILLGTILLFFLSIKYLRFVHTQRINYNTKASVINFLNTNNVLWTVLFIKIYFSIYYTNEMTILNYSLVISLIFYTLIGKNINALYLKNAQIDKSNFKIYRSRYLVLSVLFIAIIATLSFTKGLIVKNVFENNIEMLYKTLDQNLILSLIIVIAGYLDLVNQKAVRKSKSKYRPINVLYLVTLLALYLIIAPLVL
jgi:hypothetical protein